MTPSTRREMIEKIVKEEGNERDFTYNGLECRIRRWNEKLIHLCGYVVIPEGHWAYRMEYNYIASVADTNVHGGLTYSGDSIEKGVWWIGFDCAHYGDITSFETMYDGETYKDMEYVENMLKKLVDQLQTVNMECIPTKFIITREQALNHYIDLSELEPVENPDLLTT